MNIVAVSDMHGDLRNVFTALEASKPDLLVCCGDWGEAGELDSDIFQSIVARVHVLSVHGNHDDVETLSSVRNIDGTPILLPSGEVREWRGLTFAGVSGIWAKSHSKPYYVTDEDVADIAASIDSQRVDVLLSHGCAIGLADTVPSGRRGGQRCFLDLFHAVSPRLYLCGHLHKAQQRILKDGRIIINVGYTCAGDYWTIGINDKIEFERHILQQSVL